MKIGGITLKQIDSGQVLRAAGCGVAGFLAAGCCLDGRAPLTAGFLAACQPGKNAAAALCGGMLGAFAFLDFGPALRCCGILALVYTAVSAFRETSWFQYPLFRPAAAAAATLAVELVYLLQIGPTGPGLLRLGACTALSALLCHYCSLLLREAGPPKRRASREADGLRRRLRMSADALRALYESFGPPQQPKDENPAVIFDRAAEVVCRECSIRDVCWNREYVSTFNAFNDATPVLLERGRAEPGDFSSHFGSRCIHFPQLLAAINTEVTALLLRRQYRRQLEQERQRTRGQYAQLGELVAQAIAVPEAPAAAGTELAYDVAMASAPKEGQRVCGDSLTYFTVGSRRLYLLLSDGMGSGREAQRESLTTLRLLEQFLKAGIEAEPALKTMNAALNLRSDEQGSFTTIDLLCVELAERQASLYKYGAAPTYIKRQGSVRRLTSSALPAGLHDGIGVPPASRFPLEEDSLVLMISDGVADSVEDQWLQDLLAGWQGEDPDSLVSLVLQEARRLRHGDDDCSALCLYLPAGKQGRREV
ncbi:MAG: SpoIIE family protein phosphatase [Oscillospiraceae bacterium]|nr:SpoIIE family protein phosphatase [Oscillospiraceae bacterium]